mgnify:CR=1 FL=1
MSKFADLSATLDKALVEVTETKKTLDAAQNAVTDASNKHEAAVSKAQAIRSELQAELDKSLPAPQPSRVKISA